MEDKNEKSIKLIKRLIKEHVKPYFGKLFLAALCMAVVAATIATNAWLMQPILDEVFLKLSKAESYSNKIAEIKLKYPGSEFFAKRKSDTFEESTNQVFHALRKQILKNKSKK